MNWIEKWLAPVRMGTISSATVQSLGVIVQRAPAEGVNLLRKCGVFSVTLRSGGLCVRWGE